MGVSNAPTAKGKEAARGLRQATTQEERKIEAAKGSALKKGEERFEERSKTDGKSAGSKQR
jgi:DNA-binding PadR family transcriptional regulator